MEYSELVNQLVESAIVVLQPIVLALLALAIKHSSKFISQRVQNELARSLMLRLNETVWDVVQELEQTMVSRLKLATSPSSPGGVKITKEEAEDIKTEAILRIKSLFGQSGLRRLMYILGLDDSSGAASTALISAKIESAVLQMKPGQRTMLSEGL